MLAAFADRRDPRVMREVVIAVARLRWAEAPAWLDKTLQQPDPALEHAAIQALRRSANWPAVLALLDNTNSQPMRSFAGGGQTIPWGIAVDGNDNIWVANFGGQRLTEL